MLTNPNLRIAFVSSSSLYTAPHNICITISHDREGHTIVTDFGFSKAMSGSGPSWTMCGTPEYLAPEILTGEGHTLAVSRQEKLAKGKGAVGKDNGKESLTVNWMFGKSMSGKRNSKAMVTENL